MIETELAQMGAPAKIVEAGAVIDQSTRLGKRPDSELVRYVQDWVGRNNTQDQYGK